MFICLCYVLSSFFDDLRPDAVIQIGHIQPTGCEQQVSVAPVQYHQGICSFAVCVDC